MRTDPKRYVVYRRDEVVLEVVDEPGPLISRAAPPPRPGEEPVVHSFLSGTAYVPACEPVLREALEKSGSLAEYLARLRSMGFRVVERPD